MTPPICLVREYESHRFQLHHPPLSNLHHPAVFDMLAIRSSLFPILTPFVVTPSHALCTVLPSQLLYPGPPYLSYEFPLQYVSL